jgi:hypothetical protein
MPRGRPKGSRTLKPLRLSTLTDLLPEDATIMVGTTWLKGVEQLYNVKFVDPESPAQVTAKDREEVLEGGKESDAEPRERISLEEEDLG